MEFVDRTEELGRLNALARKPQGGMCVVYGRRRVGKTRLLLEWSRKHGGLYTVADPSAASVQRRYLAEALSRVFEGFQAVEYPDWRSLFQRLAAEARNRGWRGPLVLDELPCLVTGAAELPGVLQHWLYHEAKAARLVVALAGSSQRIMQGMVLDASAPLYGRAVEILRLQPLLAGYLRDALDLEKERDVVETYAVWGGTPRYWELAEDFGPDLDSAVDRLALDPLSPLHLEPDRLLLEEVPTAAALRPVLDAIGMGAHRVSEIAARIGQPATSLSRVLLRLQDLDLVRREVSFGEPEKRTKRALYRMADPFFAFWFKVVAPHRAALAGTSRVHRIKLWRKAKPSLVAGAWEDLARRSVARISSSRCPLSRYGPWTTAGRFWHGEGPEWDVVAISADERHLLLGEAKWPANKVSASLCRELGAGLLRRGVPPIPDAGRYKVVHALFLPEAPRGLGWRNGASPLVITAKHVLAALR